MKNSLLLLLLLFSAAVNAKSKKENIFAKPSITSVDGKTSPVTVTDDRNILFIGKADAGRPVRLFRGTVNIGQANADNAGNFSISVSATTITDGTYNITVQSINADNTLSVASDIFVLIINRKPPFISSIGGTRSSGTSIRNNKPSLEGTTSVPGSIQIFDIISGTEQSIGIAKVDRSGNYNFDVKTPLTTGNHIFVAKTIDEQGKIGNVSRPFNITISPLLSKPTINFINSTRISGPVTIAINTLTTQISSTTQSEKYQLFIDNVLAAESFSISFAVPKQLANGNYVLKARLIGTDGLTSEFSDPVNLTVNSTAAKITAVPTIVMVDNRTQSPIFVSDATKVLRVTGPVGAKVAIFCDGVIEPTIGVFNTLGTYATNILIPRGEQGSKANIVANITDDLGNLGPKSNVFEVIRDNINPQIPLITSIDGQTSSPAKTNKNKPQIKGKAEPNSQLFIQHFLGGITSAILGFINADANGDFELSSFEYANKSGIVDGVDQKIVVSSTDLAGNRTESDTFLLTVDKNAPNGPAESTLKARIFTVNGFLAGASTFTVNNLIVGVASAIGNKVQFFINDKLEGEQELKDSVVATFIKSNLPNGKYVLTAKAVDKQGKVSLVSDAVTVQLFSLAPLITIAPRIVSFDEQTTGTIISSSFGKKVKITAPANSKIRVFYNTKKFDLVTADASGVFEGTFPTVGFENASTVKITAFIEDEFGNFGPLSNALDVVVDNIAPTPATIASVDTKTTNGQLIAINKPVIKGKTEARATVVVNHINGTILLATVKADVNGDFTVNASDYPSTFVFAEGAQNVSAKATDEAGNAGVFGVSFSFIVDTKAPNAPIIAGVDSKTIGPFNISNNLPVLNGTAEALATINLFNGNTMLGTTTASAQGSFTFKPVTALPVGTYSFNAQAKDAVGNLSTKSSVVVVNIQLANPVLTANNALTPNGDGKNDFLTIKNIEFYPNNEVKIFDRAGRMIYTATNYKNDWDGKYNGNSLTEDTYYYSVELGSENKPFKSFITIVRGSKN
ncbi:MAG: Ig-like domain-containing protein [Bacteroidota bacterium]